MKVHLLNDLTHSENKPCRKRKKTTTPSELVMKKITGYGVILMAGTGIPSYPKLTTP
jgi:hypothetical protein